MDGSNVMGPTPIKAKKKATADQALLGAIIAGVIAVILYRFTTNIEAALYRQTVSDNFSVCIHILFFVLIYSFFLNS